jgi:hypothetical protein
MSCFGVRPASRAAVRLTRSARLPAGHIVVSSETEQRVQRIETSAEGLGLRFVFYANTGHFILREGGKPWGYVVSSRDVSEALDEAESQLEAERDRRTEKTGRGR